jgi:hypothetical protein
MLPRTGRRGIDIVLTGAAQKASTLYGVNKSRENAGPSRQQRHKLLGSVAFVRVDGF